MLIANFQSNQNNNVEKRYLALVHGHFSEKEGTINLPIYRPEFRS